MLKGVRLSPILRSQRRGGTIGVLLETEGAKWKEKKRARLCEEWGGMASWTVRKGGCEWWAGKRAPRIQANGVDYSLYMVSIMDAAEKEEQNPNHMRHGNVSARLGMEATL